MGEASTVSRGSRLRVGGRGKNNSKTPSLDTPTTIPACQSIPFGLYIIVVPFISDKNAQIDGTHFRTNWQNFES